MQTVKEDQLTECEQAVWQAAQAGMPFEGQVQASDADHSEEGLSWGPHRQVRAEVLIKLLLDGRSLSVRAIRLSRVRIVGELNLEGGTLPLPLALRQCYFDKAVMLDEASGQSIRFGGSYLPGLYARQLVTRGDLDLSDGFTAHGPVELSQARIGGELNCDGGNFHNPEGFALNAEAISVQHMFCRGAFTADGEVRLLGAHIGQLECDGAHLRNPGAIALNGDGLTVDRSMFCRNGFVADGEVRLNSAHIGSELVCDAGRWNNPRRIALNADMLTVQDMFCREGFIADGEVRLLGAHVSGDLDCEGGQFNNPTAIALNADGLRVDEDLFCRRGFSADGEVRLVNAHVGRLECNGGRFKSAGGQALIADGLVVDRDMLCNDGFTAEGAVSVTGVHVGGQLNCQGARFSNPSGQALAASEAVVSGKLVLRPTLLEGGVDLTDAEVGAYEDDPESWHALRLTGFAYGSIDPSSPVKDRLRWLTLNSSGYLPQIYDQLIGVYRRWGHDDEARKVGIAKQRQRRKRLNPAGKVWNTLLDWSVGYGYAIWKAWIWLAIFLVIGSLLFAAAHEGQFGRLADAKSGAAQPPFQPILYTLDLLLPIIGLRLRDAEIAQDLSTQILIVLFTGVGWFLAAAVALGLSGVLKKD